MSSLKPIEKRGFEDLFGMASGYVMDFTNATFSQFFQDTVQVDIYSDKYLIYGDSKAKRLRAYWTIEPDRLVGKVLDELLDIWEYENGSQTANNDRYKKCRAIVSRLIGQSSPKHTESKEEFLEREIDLPDLNKLNLDYQITSILINRLQEIEKGLSAKASLSVIFMCGSVLEGALLGIAIQKPKEFNQSSCSPKDKTGKVREFQDWTLAQLIDVACDIKLIKLDVKKFSHVLRDFRNYIHPYEQSMSGFAPDHQTAGICFQVLKAALSDLSGTR
ncbi:MAG: hypothetical protein R3B60_05110 [Candidatus Paceibacterota bacterium]